MKNDELEKIRKQLREAVPPVQPTDLQRDLWPAMLKRLEERRPGVPWFDWVLAGALGAALIFFPAVIPALLYHF
jgi:hypothetical protein